MRRALIGECLGQDFPPYTFVNGLRQGEVLSSKFWGAILSCAGTGKPGGLRCTQRRIMARSSLVRGKGKLFPLPLGYSCWPLWVSLNLYHLWSALSFKIGLAPTLKERPILKESFSAQGMPFWTSFLVLPSTMDRMLILGLSRQHLGLPDISLGQCFSNHQS